MVASMGTVANSTVVADERRGRETFRNLLVLVQIQP